ncbi:MAG: hypothetical protein G01um101419_180 [Parcubacteria group bacterium Gr01-1014_19]|nr:MAG: hypothetical protein G01um101419_180 [Parcubacteria group bacterium Gr01-1014_19]
MVTDVHVHVAEGVTEEDVRCWLRRFEIDHAWWRGNWPPVDRDEFKRAFTEKNEKDLELSHRVLRTPHIFISETGCDLPGPAELLEESLTEEEWGTKLLVIDDGLITRVLTALGKADQKSGIRVGETEKIKIFLLAHKGKKAFLVNA